MIFETVWAQKGLSKKIVQYSILAKDLLNMLPKFQPGPSKNKRIFLGRTKKHKKLRDMLLKKVMYQDKKLIFYQI